MSGSDDIDLRFEENFEETEKRLAVAIRLVREGKPYKAYLL